jgi:hypothetical protein
MLDNELESLVPSPRFSALNTALFHFVFNYNGYLKVPSSFQTPIYCIHVSSKTQMAESPPLTRPAPTTSRSTLLDGEPRRRRAHIQGNPPLIFPSIYPSKVINSSYATQLLRHTFPIM